MHEVAAPSVVSEAGVGLGPASFAFGSTAGSRGCVAANSVALAIVVSVPEPRRIVLDRLLGRGRRDRRGAHSRSTRLEPCPAPISAFNIQVCDEFGRVVELLPVGPVLDDRDLPALGQSPLIDLNASANLQQPVFIR